MSLVSVLTGELPSYKFGQEASGNLLGLVVRFEMPEGLDIETLRAAKLRWYSIGRVAHLKANWW